MARTRRDMVTGRLAVWRGATMREARSCGRRRGALRECSDAAGGLCAPAQRAAEAHRSMHRPAGNAAAARAEDGRAKVTSSEERRSETDDTRKYLDTCAAPLVLHIRRAMPERLFSSLQLAPEVGGVLKTGHARRQARAALRLRLQHRHRDSLGGGAAEGARRRRHIAAAGNHLARARVACQPCAPRGKAPRQHALSAREAAVRRSSGGARGAGAARNRRRRGGTAYLSR